MVRFAIGIVGRLFRVAVTRSGMFISRQTVSAEAIRYERRSQFRCFLLQKKREPHLGTSSNKSVEVVPKSFSYCLCRSHSAFFCVER
jgi:hypothetical protein